LTGVNDSPTFAYFRESGPVSQPPSAQCRRHAWTIGLRPRSPWREATSAFACLPPDSVVFTLPRTMAGTTEERLHVAATPREGGIAQCPIRPAWPRYGRPVLRVFGNRREGGDPRGKRPARLRTSARHLGRALPARERHPRIHGSRPASAPDADCTGFHSTPPSPTEVGNASPPAEAVKEGDKR
jgi:hypothetical protein